MNWTHPTGKAPKTVNLICLGPSSRAYLGAHMQPDLDACLEVDETWTLNRGATLFPHDLCFVMDHIGGEADKFPRYGASLWRHNKPIITSDNCEGWPNHVHKFPFDEVWHWLRTTVNPMHGNWFHNSVAYVIVYAGFIGVKELRVFGADYGNHSSGVVEDGHPCVAYWTGVMERVGLVCFAPEQSGFLNINQRDWIYGYRDDPRKIPANRARFRAMVGLESVAESTVLLSGERQVSADLCGIQPDHKARYEWAAARIGKGATVLDIGSGIGYGSAILADSGAYHVIAFERSKESIEYGKQHYYRDNVDFFEFDLDNKTFPLTPFIDNCRNQMIWSAVCFELIEHLSNPKPMLQSIPAKRLYASVPNESVIPYSPETAPFHHRHYTLAQFEQLLSETGWNVVARHGQYGPDSPVVDYSESCRTIILEAVRPCQNSDL